MAERVQNNMQAWSNKNEQKCVLNEWESLNSLPTSREKDEEKQKTTKLLMMVVLLLLLLFLLYSADIEQQQRYQQHTVYT